MKDKQALLSLKLSLLLSILAVLLILIAALARYAMQPAEEHEQAFCGNENPVLERDSIYIHGKTLFVTNCASCHAKDMKTQLTGPPLGAIEEHWKPYPRKDLYRFIRNSQKMIAEKHPQALKLWKENKPTLMNNFESLGDGDIEAILRYIRVMAEG